MYFLHPDINECGANKGGCSQICINKKGSHECKCHKGYKLEADEKACSGNVLYSIDLFIQSPPFEDL